MKKNYILLLIALLVIFYQCTNKKDKFEITLHESYDLLKIFPKLIESNILIKRIQQDSLTTHIHNSELLGDLNKGKNKTDTFQISSPEKFPLFGVMTPFMKRVKIHKLKLDSSALIGTTQDIHKLKKYFGIVDTLFPEDLQWRITGRLYKERKCVHALKKEGEKIKLDYSDIDSVFYVKIKDRNGNNDKKMINIEKKPDYWVKLKLKENLIEKLMNKTYSIFIKTINYEYSGSIVNFKNHPDQRIVMGALCQDDFNLLEKNLANRMIDMNMK